jgi:hypothetical protein
LNDGLEGWMTAAAKSPSEPDIDLILGTRNLNKFNNISSNDVAAAGDARSITL